MEEKQEFIDFAVPIGDLPIDAWPKFKLLQIILVFSNLYIYLKDLGNICK